jgi:hypothetical protein
MNYSFRNLLMGRQALAVAQNGISHLRLVQPIVQLQVTHLLLDQLFASLFARHEDDLGENAGLKVSAHLIHAHILCAFEFPSGSHMAGYAGGCGSVVLAGYPRVTVEGYFGSLCTIDHAVLRGFVDRLVR